jgi:uncharacterized protein (DUF1015 family)
MATIKPFPAIRPAPAHAAQVAALPYDVYNRQEAIEAAKGNPYSFLHIDKPEIDLAPEVDPYSPMVYEQARTTLDRFRREGILLQDGQEGYYVYALTMDGRTQTGLVCCSLVDDYVNGVIKRHELTREDKELDRIRHVDVCDANTGPIFLTYRGVDDVSEAIQSWTEKHSAVVDFTGTDGVTHRVWVLDDPSIMAVLTQAIAKVPATYIADGHHRTASAAKVALSRRESNPHHTGDEPYNYFLSVLFPHDQLKILDYNRVVRDLNGLDTETFLNALKTTFDWIQMGKASYRPVKKGELGMYLDGNWYKLNVKEDVVLADDPVSTLDVSILQRFVLEELLGILDIRRDPRIDFIGGIRGLEELERRCNLDMKVAFAMYPTSVEELMDIADAGMLMPPKSTWFEPKLRSGLFIHSLNSK